MARFQIAPASRRNIKMVLLVDGLILRTSTWVISGEDRKEVAAQYPNSKVTLALPNTWEIHPDSQILLDRPKGFETMYPNIEEIPDINEAAAV